MNPFNSHYLTLIFRATITVGIALAISLALRLPETGNLIELCTAPLLAFLLVFTLREAKLAETTCGATENDPGYDELGAVQVLPLFGWLTGLAIGTLFIPSRDTLFSDIYNTGLSWYFAVFVILNTFHWGQNHKRSWVIHRLLCIIVSVGFGTGLIAGMWRGLSMSTVGVLFAVVTCALAYVTARLVLWGMHLIIRSIGHIVHAARRLISTLNSNLDEAALRWFRWQTNNSD